MVPVINLRNEPKLREAFEYAHVHDNTVLIDRRTKWGNGFRIGPDGSREEVIARYRADLWRPIRNREIAIKELADPSACYLDFGRAGPPAGRRIRRRSHGSFQGWAVEVARLLVVSHSVV